MCLKLYLRYAHHHIELLFMGCRASVARGSGRGGWGQGGRWCLLTFGRSCGISGCCWATAPVQWVPSHLGVQGNERADEGEVRGSAQAFRNVMHDWQVQDIWEALGLEEMDDVSHDNMSGAVSSDEDMHSTDSEQEVESHTDSSAFSFSSPYGKRRAARRRTD